MATLTVGRIKQLNATEAAYQRWLSAIALLYRYPGRGPLSRHAMKQRDAAAAEYDAITSTGRRS